MNKKIILLVVLTSLQSKLLACDVCNIFEFKTVDQKNYIGVFYHYMSFNGYDHLNQPHQLFSKSPQMHELDGSNLFFEKKQQDFEKYSTFALRANINLFKNFRLNVLLPYEHTVVYYNKVWSTLDPVSDTTMLLSGLGDAIVGIDKNIRFKTDQFTHYLIPGLSLKLPTGITNIKDNADEVFDPEIQPGTGSLDVLLKLNYTLTNGKWGVFSATNYKINSTHNGYRFANSFNFQSDIFLILGNPKKQFIPQAGLYLERAGNNLDNGNIIDFTGGSTVFFDSGMELRLNNSISFQFSAQLPIYDQRNNTQIGNAGRLNVGLIKMI
ncbi:hypothetical protein SAMN05661096_02771 [Marivirga sericea]|uniref:MetA-pathway of phenol degradation n=1 Tax=Marivirga sericea TaxID=1028 RepID=A0A1X7KHT7_9BACT|nr:hypothetical protein [Marivirga sericea]SMG40576.1 hypothetical protein SAMN05661096_02771 [Marivirga sericea]